MMKMTTPKTTSRLMSRLFRTLCLVTLLCCKPMIRCLAFLPDSSLLSRRLCRYGEPGWKHPDPRMNPLPPLCAEKKGFSLANIFRRSKTPDRKYTSTRTSPYLISMDKQRGYHRKTLGGVAQIVNNTEVNFMSPPQLAGAIVGKLSSKAFK